MNYTIKKEIAEQVLNYLSTRPFVEVSNLISAFQSGTLSGVETSTPDTNESSKTEDTSSNQLPDEFTPVKE